MRAAGIDKNEFSTSAAVPSESAIAHAALEPVPHALGPQKDDPAVKEETQNYVSAVGVNPIMKGTWGSWCIGGVSQVRH